MCDLIPIIEGPVKFREGKKWKQRFACVTRLSPVAGKTVFICRKENAVENSDLFLLKQKT